MSLYKYYSKKILRILIGLLLISANIFISKQSLCLPPWEVLNDGLSHVTGMNLGTAGIVVGALILIVDFLSGEKLGFGSVINIIIIGLIVDLFMYVNGLISFFPRIESLPWQIFFCIIAQILRGMGTFYYMTAQLGSGPRDTLNLFLSRRFRVPLGLCSLIMEVIAGLLGWALGGEVGAGTFVSMFLGGPLIQFFFWINKYDSSSIRNESFAETVRNFKNKAI